MEFKDPEVDEELCDDEETVEDDEADDGDLELVGVEEVGEFLPTRPRELLPFLRLRRHRTVRVVLLDDAL